MELIRTAPHEFDAQLNINEHGLAPYFAADAQVKDGGGAQYGSFSAFGDDWTATLSYQDSGIVHPGATTPQGTEFRLDTIREFRLKVKAQDDVGERKFTAHLRPRWQGMQVENRNGTRFELSLPEGFLEGVNVRVQGANIEFRRYHQLLELAADAVGINAWYFEEVHDSSNIQDAERYVRIDRDYSGPIHARDGPIWALGHLLENDRDGYRKIVQDDRDGHANNLPGYYHTVTLDQRRIQEAWPDHQLPKEIKHYYAREALDRDQDDPLAHPKLGASYQVSQHDETFQFSSENLERLDRELEEAVHSVLQDAGIDISPRNGGVFVEDAYFDAELHDADQPTAIDITELKHDQESIVVRYLADGVSPLEEEIMDHLVTDGGRVSPEEIADENERHLWSVYRALRRMDDLIDRKYGEVALRSNYVAELVFSALQDAREAMTTAANTAARAVEASERQFGEAMEQFVAWAARHNVDYSNRAEALEIDLPEGTNLKMRFGKPSGKLAHLVREGFNLWKAAGQDPERFLRAPISIGGMKLQGVFARSIVRG